MDHSEATELKKHLIETGSVSGSSIIRKRKGKKRDERKPIAGASTRADRRAGSLQKCRNGTDEDSRDQRHEPATEKAKLPQGRRPLGPVIDFDGLSRPSSGTRSRLDEGPQQAEERLKKMRGAVRTLLECVGEDPDREGLLATPSRYARALLFLTKGYQVDVANIVKNAVFNEGHDEMVIVKDIDIHSLCEHHLVPFTGKVTDTSHKIHVPLISYPKLTDALRCTSAISPPTP